jgi:hypothetical protein
MHLKLLSSGINESGVKSLENKTNYFSDFVRYREGLCFWPVLLPSAYDYVFVAGYVHAVERRSRRKG